MSLPTEFCLRMERLLGDEYPAFLRAMEGPRSYGLRRNPLKCTPDSADFTGLFGLTPVPWAVEGFYYDPDTRPGRHPYYEAGAYYIQEPSAMAVGALADPKPGERVLDLCAAPGGKTTHLAGRMAGKGILIANEIHPARAKILSQSVERAGIANCIVTNETPQRLAERFHGYFDCIVVDAPCSGEGMFRKEEIAVTEWTPDAPQKCAARQDEILDCAAGMLRPGGRLVYSTCTFAPEEDEGTVARLLARHPEFEVCDVPGDPAFAPGRPDWAGVDLPALMRTFRLFPHRLRGEGHFAAVLCKTDGTAETPALMPTLPDKKRPAEYLEFEARFLCRMFGSLCLGGDQLWALPEETPDLSGLRVLRTGLQLGTVKKGRFEPSHALALALHPDEAAQCCALTAAAPEAERYLRGETLPCAGAGWTLVTVDGFSLGWGKCSGGVLKNHYPKGLRWK
ncbi:RsmB/NOP family class I SAM-dependent RNA methyltransferase [Butyricicoccus pullicaecorum]|nr:RsmB/NOP family class I SAM-dependent RNA methyltransferase [Butyricicoccus pullicaecorum]